MNIALLNPSATVSRARRNFSLLKMAHTGKAALNIHGLTIHSALEICPDGNSSPNKLNSFKLYTLRNRLNGLLLIIIDEISLVSHGLFPKINKRLNEIFRTSNKSNVYFSNVPVIAFGDMAQIEPVAAKQVFYRPPGELFSLWHDLFRPINFDIHMQQGNARLFFNCLCRMRMGCLDEETENLIKSRSIREEDNPDAYKERLKELNSAEFEDAVYAWFSITRLISNQFWGITQYQNITQSQTQMTSIYSDSDCIRSFNCNFKYSTSNCTQDFYGIFFVHGGYSDLCIAAVQNISQVSIPSIYYSPTTSCANGNLNYFYIADGLMGFVR